MEVPGQHYLSDEVD